jgi:hypothetical protein
LKDVTELARLEHDLDFTNPAVFYTQTAFGYHSWKTTHHAALQSAQLPEFGNGGVRRIRTSLDRDRDAALYAARRASFETPK